MNRCQITSLVLTLLAAAALDPSDSIYLALPRQGDFTHTDLSVDRQQELHRVESSDQPRMTQMGTDKK